jgi:hypothetical protein
MTKSLTTIISNVQALLLDDGTRFSTATVTAAVREALKEFNQRAPIFAGTLVDVVSGQKEYVLNASDFTNLIDVQSVLKQSADDDHTELTHDVYFEDAVPVIRLREAQSSGFLIVRYTIPYTVNGLDSEVESTLPTFFDDVLIDGACFWSAQIRSAGRIETINLNQGVAENWLDVRRYFRLAFDVGLIQAARRRAPVSEPSTAAWNDKFVTTTWKI